MSSNLWLFLSLLFLLSVWACSSCEPSNDDPTNHDCWDAAWKANYSEDHATITEGMAYFERYCTWRNGNPVVK